MMSVPQSGSGEFGLLIYFLFVDVCVASWIVCLAEYDITRPSNYQLVNRNNVREQLAKGGFRLAKLLDAIFAQ
jgi:hypothetical protein